jgi:hypothetical protein
MYAMHNRNIDACVGAMFSPLIGSEQVWTALPVISRYPLSLGRPSAPSAAGC